MIPVLSSADGVREKLGWKSWVSRPVCGRSSVTGSPGPHSYNICCSTPALSRLPSLPTGSQQDVPRVRGVSCKTKGNTVLRGAVRQHCLLHSCQDQTPKPPSAEAGRRGAGWWALLEDRRRSCVTQRVVGSPQHWAQGCSQQGRHILGSPL